MLLQDKFAQESVQRSVSVFRELPGLGFTSDTPDDDDDNISVFFQVLSGKKMELLPGDRGNLAIQTRGGPEKHEVTGWVLVSTQL